jgi:TPR repeat protein
MHILNYLKNIIIFAICGAMLTACSTGKYTSKNPGEPAKTYTSAEMGVRYLLGRGVPQSYEQAFHYFKEAAGNDDPLAQNELAYLYAAGRGTAQSYEKALYYYRQAADHGLASAQFNLGLMYANGLGIAPNQLEAAHWIGLSASHGFEPAKQYLKLHPSQPVPYAHAP